jgi:type II secretory pathway pseudopilin PulG
MSSLASPRGFTLFETLVATGILVTALAGIAQLFVLGTHLSRQASASGQALVMAQDKLEYLRGLTFAFDVNGGPVTDPGLTESPADSLHEDRAPYRDWLDASGNAGVDAADAVFARRWRISTVGAASPEAITLEVCVFAMPVAGRRAQAADACLSTIRTRQP